MGDAGEVRGRNKHANMKEASDDTKSTKSGGNRHPECKLWDLILDSATLMAAAVIIAVTLTTGEYL